MNACMHMHDVYDMIYLVGGIYIEIEYMSLKSLTCKDIYVRPLIYVRLRPLLLTTWKKQHVKEIMLMLMLMLMLVAW